MSSILTNNSAMVALQTLKGINKNLANVQNQISTGKSVGTAKDNAAVWAISKVMESDVSGFKAISSSLSLGESTVSVARQASETVTDLLTQMKEKIVASQESNVDRDKIQTDIEALRSQIESVVGAAQFNGLNLLDATPENIGATNTIAQQIENSTNGDVKVLSSLDRSASGVTSSSISVSKESLSQTAQTAGTVATSATTMAATAVTANTATIANNATESFGINGDTATAARGGNRVLAGDTYTIAASFFDKLAPVAGAGIATDISDPVAYVAKAGDTTADIAENLALRVNQALTKAGYDEDYQASFVDNGDGTAEFQITNSSGSAGNAAFAPADFVVTTGGTAGGGLEILADMDVSSANGAKAALAAVENLISTTIDSAASFGSAQGRIEIQSEFISGLTDALKSGIGTLVDADMEEASARLQALQVQQQLGVQSLSIANQAPQSILSLFR
ncbi:flagellin [Maribius pontilimi]|uniref:Flagellin n=1 Tax=Palleronia pontilimi TaxID=1964209 RepID=A0A934IJM9_9RHOB|nr:flagellin [Palleronia pontilimi]MBJ3763169.1 flagellin [Palleronia pontilimi]